MPSLTVLALGISSAGAEEAVLLSATAPGYSPGMIIPDGKAVSLPDGSRATVLLRSGRMLELKGPFRGPIQIPTAEAGSSVLAAVKALAEQTVDMSAAGGTRSGASIVERATDGRQIVVAVEHPATYCLGPADTIALQQPALGGQAISLDRAGTPHAVSWPADSSLAAWPADLPIADGDRISVMGRAGAADITLTFRRLAIPTSDRAWIAQALLLGCVTQARPALQDLLQTSVAPQLYLSSDRGRHPTYRVGERLALVLQSNRDGHLYCLAKQSDGAIVPIFPAGATDGARIQGHIPLSIPGPRLSIEMRIGPPPGRDDIRCYLSSRNLAAELPAAILDKHFTPLAGDLADDPDKAFRVGSQDAGQGWIIKTSLTVRVE